MTNIENAQEAIYHIMNTVNIYMFSFSTDQLSNVFYHYFPNKTLFLINFGGMKITSLLTFSPV